MAKARSEESGSEEEEVCQSSLPRSRLARPAQGARLIPPNASPALAPDLDPHVLIRLCHD